MSGLIFVVIVGLWAWMAFKLSRFIGRRVFDRWAMPLAALLFLVLFPLPVIDEIVGGFQFRALCAKDAKIDFKVDPASLKGKTVRVVVQPSNKAVEGSVVRIYYSHYSYREVDGNDELLNYTRYVAEGGVLIRALSGDRHIAPTTFPSTCDPLSSANLDFKVQPSAQ